VATASDIILRPPPTLYHNADGDDDGDFGGAVSKAHVEDGMKQCNKTHGDDAGQKQRKANVRDDGGAAVVVAAARKRHYIPHVGDSCDDGGAAASSKQESAGRDGVSRSRNIKKKNLVQEKEQQGLATVSNPLAMQANASEVVSYDEIYKAIT
jgi:hypothetical protein